MQQLNHLLLVHGRAQLNQPFPPVDIYVEGRRHAIVHLPYTCFINRLLCQPSLGCWQPIIPFCTLLVQGLVLAQTVMLSITGKYTPVVIQHTKDGSPIDPSTGETLVESGEKVSKSKHHGVEPDDVIAQFGADAVQPNVLFNVPVANDLEWDCERV